MSSNTASNLSNFSMTALEQLAKSDPDVYHAMMGENERQKHGIELIPSENYTYPEVLAANGSIFTNKYAEGYPGRRYYGGQEFTDKIETLAIERAKKLFDCEHANVQPLSGSPMNQAVYMSLLDPGDTVVAMDLSHGGHLTHGAPVSHMGRIYNFKRYKSYPDQQGKIDYDLVLKIAKKHKPKMILCGYSSYPRDLDYDEFKRVADQVGALTMADISHIGGLVAGKAMRNPFDSGFDIVTTTTHKSLRGPRGGMILCRKEFAQRIDKGVFPGLQGGPHMNVIAGVAITLHKALQLEFQQYARQVMRNAKCLANYLLEQGVTLVTGGTDNHLMVIDTLKSFNIDGRIAEEVLDKVNITVNKQLIPDDPNPPLRPSGIRLGTPAATARGFMEKEMDQLANWLVTALQNHDDHALLTKIRGEVETFCLKYPVPGVI